MKRKRFFLAPCVFLTILVASAAYADLTPTELLGKNLFFDKISVPNSMSCADCHSPRVGFTGPIPGINRRGAVYPGAVPQRAGNRKPPSAAYATLSPVFHFDDVESLFVGGNFWDGRATGEGLGNPAADQALGPFLNPVEQNNPSKQAVLESVASSRYAWLWESVYGEELTYGTPAEIELNYNRVGLAIASYEASTEVNQFSSKFDLFWENSKAASMDVSAIDMANWRDYEGLGLDEEELEGLALFNDEDKGKCALCHVLDPVSDGFRTESPPIFTDFTFDNLGVPKNPDNPFYDMDEVLLDNGDPINPDGADWIDPGLGGFLAGQSDPEWQAMAAANYGKHKVPTLRNVAKGPSKKFGKAYMHNGVFKSLEEVVHFYNTRDVEEWPPPEVPQNVNTEELGNLGLTEEEEAAIVAFMTTLSDGYRERPSKTSPAPVATALRIFPNPFNPTTEIGYSLPEAGEVKVTVHNLAGRIVAELADGHQEKGDYRVVFDANGLSSGIYFVRVVQGETTTTAKALLLR